MSLPQTPPPKLLKQKSQTKSQKASFKSLFIAVLFGDVALIGDVSHT